MKFEDIKIDERYHVVFGDTTFTVIVIAKGMAYGSDVVIVRSLLFGMPVFKCKLEPCHFVSEL